MPPKYEPWLLVVPLLARAGLPKEAAAALRRLPPPESPAEAGFRQEEAPLLRAEIAAAEGRPTEVIRLLQHVPFRAFMRKWWMARETLAKALEQQGDRRGALAALAAPAGRPAGVFTADPAGAHADVWLEIQATRARLLRAMDRPDEAQAIEAQLGKYLACADPAHPLVQMLAKR